MNLQVKLLVGAMCFLLAGAALHWTDFPSASDMRQVTAAIDQKIAADSQTATTGGPINR